MPSTSMQHSDWLPLHSPSTPPWLHCASDKTAQYVADPREFGASILVHTSVPFGIQHLDRKKDEVEQIILSHVKQVLPTLPQPAWTYCHRWRYSQVSRAFNGAPGCITINESPLLVVGGDAFVHHSNFDGCVESALSLVKRFSELNDIKGHL